MLLKSLNEQGQTIVMVTHDPKAAAYGSRIITLKDGALVEDISIGGSHHDSYTPAPVYQS